MKFNTQNMRSKHYKTSILLVHAAQDHHDLITDTGACTPLTFENQDKT